MKNNNMVNEAIEFATQAHSGQFRKGTKIPFIVHPMEVFSIVARMTDKSEVWAAAILHDVVEDCEDVTIEQIRDRFGDYVAFLVASESEDKSLSWKERKQITIDRTGRQPMDVKFIAMADKLSNIRSVSHDYFEVGDELWQRFRMKDKAMQGWYYKGMCESLKSLNEYAEYQEFCRLVSKVFD